jgi:hypothetical protein
MITPTQGTSGPARPGPQDARHVPLTRAQRLAQDAADAAQVRAYQTHPDVVALRIERIRSQVDRLCWAGIVLGLAFTMTNVQVFAAAGAAMWSLPWLAAWVLDPTVSLVLLAILRAEQITARYQVRTGRWVRAAKWFTLAATYVMNVWASWAAGSTAGVVLHSVPPLLVFVAAEAVTDLRDKLTDAVTAAVNAAVVAADGRTTAGEHTTGAECVHGVHEPTSRPNDARMTRRRTAVREHRPAGGPSRRTSFAEYLSMAHRAWTPGVEVTPAWVRQVTGCSRGLSSRLAAVLRTEITGNGGAGRGSEGGQ